jgi:dihydrodipicolinate synthase/N-acetylneuraminate lyase
LKRSVRGSLKRGRFGVLRIAPAEAATAEHGIPAIKCVMELFGYYGGIPRLPKVPLSPAQRDEIVALFTELRS